MHLLAATPGQGDSADDAIDLDQTPADIVFLSAADSELNLINRAYEALRETQKTAPSLRLANLLQLRNNFSVDLYMEKTLRQSRLVIVRLLGGVSYWSYGVEEISKLKNCVFLPGDEKFDETLARYCHGIGTRQSWQLWQYLVHGGTDNALNFLRLSACLLQDETQDKAGEHVPPPQALPKAGIYLPDRAGKTAKPSDFAADKSKPNVAILFYRAYLQSGDLQPIDAFITSLAEQGLQAVPIYCSGLKDADSAAIVKEIFAATKPQMILNSLGFHLGFHLSDAPPSPSASAEKHGKSDISAYWQGIDLKAPVLQIILSSQSQEVWQERNNALNIRDIAMYIALTELNGNILSRAVSFKSALPFSEATQITGAVHQAEPDRVRFVAELTRAYCDLQTADNADKRIALVLANYPGKDGRLANGVGLDTPASAVEILSALQAEGYNVAGFDSYNDPQKLMRKLQAIPTNAVASAAHKAALCERQIEQTLSLAKYRKLFGDLPQAVQSQITEQWGEPESDPFFMAERQAFALPFFICGHIAIGIQPARGYHIDPTATYHDPALVPPHGYCAAYLWLRYEFSAHAITHLGKHGNLEWLPGKALALSQACYPEALLGALPHIYPFIVNDPGEGSQAKRRTQATIIDHLTPPMMRAESYGVLSALESLCDEYYESLLMDPKRARFLRQEILDFAAAAELDKDGQIDLTADEADIITALDGFLCDLKESQIRGGLHIFMQNPPQDKLAEFAVALLRYPRFDGQGENQSLLQALAKDLQLPPDFNPLDCEFAAAYDGHKPEILAHMSQSAWRHCGDAVERLSLLAQKILSGDETAVGENSRKVLDYWHNRLSKDLQLSAVREKTAYLRAHEGAFIAPGASGAPTRARPDVLPTGRNFYSVDMRAVPTAAAWQLGWASAQMIAERHAQEHGDYPTQVVVNVWGTSNMRTGGDDIAQAMALLGVRPQWDDAAKRVIGFEILPLSLLGRPRIDVTLRISGFFRDAFPSLVELFDKASRAVQKLDESGDDNPSARHYADSLAELTTSGHDDKTAALMAGRRIFGSPSGAYGAGLQALIDEGIWQDRNDIAEAYMSWGGYAYGVNDDGQADRQGFAKLLQRTQAVIHNQDNREHDVLDSDDYYQFEGGVSAAIESLSGRAPEIYHNDHANPAAPKIRTLKEEIARTVRARAANPKWLEAIMQHGYKGAFEIAATVDYLFAFAATTDAVQNHHFDILFDAYIADDKVGDFIRNANPAAWQEICDRFAEAVSRGLWKPKSNAWSEKLNGKN